MSTLFGESVIGDVESDLGSSNSKRQTSRFRRCVGGDGVRTVSGLKALEFKPERRQAHSSGVLIHGGRWLERSRVAVTRETR